MLDSALPAFGLLVCLWLPACKDCSQRPAQLDGAGAEVPADRRAMSLTGLSGVVQWRLGKDAAWQDATEGQVIRIGDGLRTAGGAKVSVVFHDGGRLQLDGGAQVTLRGVENELELLLQEGQIAMATHGTTHRGFRVVFGDSSEVVIMREGRAELTRRPGGVTIRMIMGQATILQGEERTELAAGKTFLLRIGKAQIIGRERVATTLMDVRRTSRIRPPGEKRFVRPEKRQLPVEPDTAIRTRAGSVVLSDAAGGRVMLGPRTQAVFGGAYRSPKGRDGALQLDSGKARIALRRDPERETRQEVVTPQASVKASARGLTADVAVASRTKSTEVVVHTGRAEVTVQGETIAVPSGHSLVVDEHGRSREVSRLAAPRILGGEGGRTRVYFDRGKPAVALTWQKPNPDETLILEVSSTSDFSSLRIREPVEGRRFILQELPRGRHHWRLVRSQAGKPATAGPAGVVIVQRDPLVRRIRASALTNVVPDTGQKTTIYFQGKVPALTFRWKAVQGAAGYRVRVYAEDNLESPILTEQAPTSRLLLGAGKLKEGTYFWYQAAYDERGKELHTSQMNKLVVSFDNAATLMRVDSPRPGQRPRNGRVEVRGLAPARSKVTVNGHPLRIPQDGRFRQTLRGVRPGEVLVFHLRGRGLGDVYTTRHLGR